jgi:hypothetical protein
MVIEISSSVELPEALAVPGLRGVAFIEYRLNNAARERKSLLGQRDWSVLGTTPFGDELLGVDAEKAEPEAKPAFLLSRIDGDANPHPGLRSVGLWVEDVEAATEALWALEGADVFDGGPVGLLRLRIPACRWQDGRFYYLLAADEGYGPLKIALATGRNGI